MHARCDLPDLTAANVNLLTDQLLTIGMIPNFDDLADPDVKLGDVRFLDDLSRCGLGLCLRSLRLLLLLLVCSHSLLGLLLF